MMIDKIAELSLRCPSKYNVQPRIRAKRTVTEFIKAFLFNDNRPWRQAYIIT